MEVNDNLSGAELERLRIARIEARQARKRVNRARYRRQYARAA